MSSLAVGSQACFIIFVGSTASFDALQRRVPNGLILAGMLSAMMALSLGVQLEGVGWVSSLLGFVVGLFAFLPMYLLGFMGAGDVKFFSAIGLWLGIHALLPVWIIASIIAGLQALIWLVLSRRTEKLGPAVVILNGLRLKETPYASYLAIGAVAMLFFPRLLGVALR